MATCPKCGELLGTDGECPNWCPGAIAVDTGGQLFEDWTRSQIARLDRMLRLLALSVKALQLRLDVPADDSQDGTEL